MKQIQMTLCGDIPRAWVGWDPFLVVCHRSTDSQNTQADTEESFQSNCNRR
jgi:hypothetical protein